MLTDAGNMFMAIVLGDLFALRHRYLSRISPLSRRLTTIVHFRVLISPAPTRACPRFLYTQSHLHVAEQEAGAFFLYLSIIDEARTDLKKM